MIILYGNARDRDDRCYKYYKINNHTAKAPESPRDYRPLTQNGYAYEGIGLLYTNPAQVQVSRRWVRGPFLINGQEHHMAQ